jgi:predicted Zn-dependent protease with MMP-like domain
MNRKHWEQLERLAQEVVDDAIAELPEEIRDKAREVPCLFQEYSEDDPDLLGLYADFEPGEISAANGPIILYLAAIEAYCDEEGEDFADEVRVTYLHELGHHFGWDEGDLEERGLL